MRRLLPAVLILAALSSCGKPSEEELWAHAQSARASGNIDSTVYWCTKIVGEYPEGRTAPNAMYVLGQAYQARRDFPQAIDEYRLFTARFPKAPQAPEALFMVGYIFNNELHQYDSAKAAYERYIDRYPDGQLVNDARFEMANMGKTPDEIIDAQQAKSAKGQRAKR